MNVDELFKNAQSGSAEEISEFWKQISLTMTTGNPYQGIQKEEIKAYLTLNENKFSCACGNEPYNCICYNDAE